MQHILPVSMDGFKSVRALFTEVTRDLRRKGVYQWDWFYPNRFIVRADIKDGRMFGVRQENRYIGVVVLDDRPDDKHAGLPWNDRSGRPASIHRLAVHPDFQGQGLGKKLLQFAERRAAEQGYTSLRLDVYAGNPSAVGMYERAGYRHVGEVRYPMRKLPYYCMEKPLSVSS